MKPNTFTRLILILLTLFPCLLNAQDTQWTLLGGTNTGVDPYPFVYYKVVEVKDNAARYANIIDISVQGDANYFEQQGTFKIRVDKFEGTTTGRFDGVEIRCTSGNPSAAVFYVYNNAVWMRASYKWGAIFNKTDGIFAGYSPLTGGDWGSTTTEPTGYLAMTNTHGLKCDFDNNQFFKLPHSNPIGDFYVGGRVGIGVPYAYNTLVLPNTGSIAWKHTNGDGEIIGINSNASNDFTVYAGGPDRLYIKSSTGNVGIGTTNPGDYKLAVEGTIGARRVKVTSLAWADFVFEDHYRLMPLRELEQYIAANKHLPGIPSAKTVEKEGIELGEMDSKLLQKIEEQTLYIIELHKKLEDVTKRLHQLESNSLPTSKQ